MEWVLRLATNVATLPKTGIAARRKASSLQVIRRKRSRRDSLPNNSKRSAVGPGVRDQGKHGARGVVGVKRRDVRAISVVQGTAVDGIEVVRVVARSAVSIEGHPILDLDSSNTGGEEAEVASREAVHNSAGPTTPTTPDPPAFSLASVVSNRHLNKLAKARYSAS